MSDKKKGRPKGIQKDERLHVMISKNLKDRFKNAVQNDRTNVSVKTCELIMEYVKKIEKNNK